MKHTEPITEETVRQQIDALLGEVVGVDAPIIIGVLRYGAHLPHLWREARTRPPIRVILSHMIEYLPAEVFEAGKFLVLDDTVFRGHQMKKCRQRLLDRGVAADRIRTAAVVVHEDADDVDDFPKARKSVLNNREYIQWKNRLCSLVKKGLRPTDRDHPLYFFKVSGISSGRLLAFLERYGRVTCQGQRCDGAPFVFSININSSLLTEPGSSPLPSFDEVGISLGNLCKLRVYWSDQGGVLKVTFVPIVFPEINIAQFVRASAFERLVGVPLNDLDYLRQNPEAWAGYIFFLASRSLAACLMLRFMTDFRRDILGAGGSISLEDPTGEDYPVEYVFPASYTRFYKRVFDSISSLLSTSEGADMSALSFPWPCAFDEGEVEDPRVQWPHVDWNVRVLSAVVDDTDPAEFDGRRWIQNTRSTSSASFSSLDKKIDNGLAVSICLDDLLDAGLLRAKDGKVSDAELGTYARVFLPGGEFNALQVSRLTESYRAEGETTGPADIEEPDLWVGDEC